MLAVFKGFFSKQQFFEMNKVKNQQQGFSKKLKTLIGENLLTRKQKKFRVKKK